MSRQVLLVDDEPMVTEELQEALEFEGYAVTATNSVPEALAACNTGSFEAIITDLKMPGQGGLDLLRSLRDLQYPSKVVVLSGHGAESNRVEATELGASACFAKPVDVDELIETIEEICG